MFSGIRSLHLMQVMGSWLSSCAHDKLCRQGTSGFQLRVGVNTAPENWGGVLEKGSIGGTNQLL